MTSTRPKVHQNEEVCTGCEKKLEQADPRIARWFRERVKPLKPDAHIAWAFRGPDDQRMEFLEGRSQLDWPHSKHNAMNDGRPAALALDLFRLAGNSAEYSMSFFYAIWEDAEKAGIPLRWGGKFKTLGDATHFEWNEDSDGISR